MVYRSIVRPLLIEHKHPGPHNIKRALCPPPKKNKTGSTQKQKHNKILLGDKGDKTPPRHCLPLVIGTHFK